MPLHDPADHRAGAVSWTADDPLGAKMAYQKIGRLSGQVTLGSGTEADLSE
jgi:hypothetical protein